VPSKRGRRILWKGVDVILCPAKEKHPEKMLIRRIDKMIRDMTRVQKEIISS